MTNNGPLCVFQTNKGAERFKLVTIDLQNPSESNWKDLVAECPKGGVLEWACGVAGSKLVTCYMNDVKNTLQLRQLDSGEVTYEFPLFIGSVTGFSGEIKYSEMFYKFSSQVTPGIIYHVNLTQETPEVNVFLETKVAQFDSSQFKVEQVK